MACTGAKVRTVRMRVPVMSLVFVMTVLTHVASIAPMALSASRRVTR